jgi:hypothetical protein
MAVDLKRAFALAPVPTVETRRYQFVDYATQAYLGIVGLIVIVLHGDRLGEWPLLVGLHVAGMVGIHLVLRAHAVRPHNLVLAFLRFLYPMILMPALYRETGVVNLLLTGKYHDRLFVVWEESLFGLQPVVRFVEAFPQRGIATSPTFHTTRSSPV